MLHAMFLKVLVTVLYCLYFSERARWLVGKLVTVSLLTCQDDRYLRYLDGKCSEVSRRSV